MNKRNVTVFVLLLAFLGFIAAIVATKRDELESLVK